MTIGISTGTRGRLRPLFGAILLLTLFLTASLPAAGQAKIFTKKARIADFPIKTVKVVMSGNAILDLALQKEMTERWYLSPYEFCSVDDFNRLESDPNYYFLRFVLRPSDPGLVFLSLMKGGTLETRQTTDTRYELVRLPFAPEGMGSAREYIFLGAFLEILQQYVEDAIAADRLGYLGLWSQNKLLKMSGLTILIADEDISPEGRLRAEQTGGAITVVETDEADAALLEGADNTLVSFCVSPYEPSLRAHCYDMLIRTDTGELYRFSRHRYTSEGKRGFGAAEINMLHNILSRNADRSDK